MKYYFCTLFDKNYLSKGIALHSSLRDHLKSFHLWILCMDDITLNILRKMKLINTTLIDLASFEDVELKQVKIGRTHEEYCWTCTPSLLLFILKKYPEIKHIGYLDADLYFYSTPKPIFDEWGKESILIIPHNFPHYLKYKEVKSGKYNVSMVLFKNDKNAINCLTWWRDKCIEWCFREYDNGRLGDQLYLNEWPEIFKSVHVLQNKTAGVAPWNVLNYNITFKKNRIYIDNEALIFYHFHGVRKYTNGLYKFVNGYELSRKVQKLIYEPYIRILNQSEEKIKKIHPTLDFRAEKPLSIQTNLMEWLFIMKLKYLRVMGV